MVERFHKWNPSYKTHMMLKQVVWALYTLRLNPNPQGLYFIRKHLEIFLKEGSAL